MTSDEKLKELDEKMKKAGMIPVSEILKNPPINRFIIHAGMDNLEFFREWLRMRYKEYLTMQAKMMLETSQEHDEMFEWVLAHSAVFGEVIANFDAAVKKS